MENNFPPLKISGTIPYELSRNEKGEWLVEYGTTVENDIAVAMISRVVIDTFVSAMEQDKPKLTGTALKSCKVLLKKAIESRFGIGQICSHMLQMYEIHVNRMNEKEAKGREDEAKVLKMTTDEKGN